MLKRTIAMLLVVLLVAASFVACGSNDNNNANAGNNADANAATNEAADTTKEFEGKKVGMVTDSGTITDKSFNQGTWEGILKAADEFGIAEKYLQPGGETTDDYLTEIGNLVDSDHGIIITPGFKFEEAIFLAQDKYPDTMFVLIDGAPHSADYSEFRTEANVVSVFFAEQEAGFLAGVAAALESETGKIGFIGGMEIPPVQKFGWGFTAGVAYANANFDTTAQVVDYIYQGTFHEVDAGQQIAASMYDKGVDVIHAAAGGVGVGAINEAKTRKTAGENVWIVGVDVDQYADGMIEDGTSIILTSAMKKIDTAAYDYIEAYLKGNFPGGQTINLSAKDGGVGLPVENPNLSDDTAAKTAEVLAGLQDGSIVAPATVEDLTSFLEAQGYTSADGMVY
ncbi:MAG: BMP family ABC transporter substrate-binding protein [Clostridiales bacterium]|nr:BMP family ABC transporter substrate-binding protein [Clostridiales bacterium]